MYFFSVALYGLVLTAGILLYLFFRDQKNPTTFLGRHQIIAWIFMSLCVLGILTLFYARFIEPNLLRIHRQTILIPSLSHSLTIAFISDLHVGTEKKAASVARIVQKINSLHPDLVLLGGDYIVNNATTQDETVYLSPLKELAKKYPVFAVMGNHEYGYGDYGRPLTGDKSSFIKQRFTELRIPLLINNLVCPTIHEQAICLFGNDDVYRKNYNFTQLKNWDEKIPLIQISHNPDGVLFWPAQKRNPDLELSGHTHGGQIWLPLIGPLGQVDVRLGTGYYRGLNFWHTIPIFTSVGAGESGTSLRLFTPPEIALITLLPQK